MAKVAGALAGVSPQAPTGNSGVADTGGRESAGVLSPTAAVAGGRESTSLTAVAGGRESAGGQGVAGRESGDGPGAVGRESEGGRTLSLDAGRPKVRSPQGCWRRA